MKTIDACLKVLYERMRAGITNETDIGFISDLADMLRRAEINTAEVMIYDPYYGDEKICKCSHPYYRHFDTYDNMAPVGCKYCHCDHFEEI